MADLWNNALVEPTWLTSNPPLKVNVPAKTYGLVLGILAVLGAIGALIAMIAAFTFSATIGSLATSVCNYDHSIGLSPAGCGTERLVDLPVSRRCQLAKMRRGQSDRGLYQVDRDPPEFFYRLRGPQPGEASRRRHGWRYRGLR